MPRAKAPSHYPLEYLEICHTVGIEAKTWRVPVPDTRHAMKLRGHFYAFIGSVRSLVKALPEGTARDPVEEKWLTVSHAADRVMVSIEGTDAERNVTVVFVNREASWQSKVLRSAQITAADGSAVQSSAVGPSADFLREVADLQGGVPGLPAVPTTARSKVDGKDKGGP